MRKIKNKIASVHLMLGMVLLVIGFSYAFFIYNKTGLYTHTITGGKMKVIYEETTGNNILIENAYPRTDVEALTYGLEFEFTVTGYNESEKNVYYAIEMDYGDDLDGKNRFLDTDMKLSLFENNELVFENEIFNNLDNQDIHYGYFKAGTNSQTPTVNNYMIRIWINDNVIISDTLSNNLNDWGNYEWEWLYESYPDKYEEVYNGDDLYLSDYGISIYTSDEFANSYANFKVNIKADLTYDDIGYLTYDANGGEFDVEKTSLVTGMVTTRKPVMEGKGFLGWSSNQNATTPEYLSGQTYKEDGQMLYAVYGDTRNVMGVFPTEIQNVKRNISEVYFINDKQSNIDERYNVALENSVAVDLTLDNQGSVKGWIELDDDSNGILYVGSEGTTYLTDCSYMFSEWSVLENVYFTNADTSMVEDMSHMFEAFMYTYSQPVTNEVYDNLIIESLKYNDNYKKRITPIATEYISSLINVDLETLNTKSVLDMSYMFWHCYSLTELELKYFDTFKVTNMSHMFFACNGLVELDLNNFDTSKVTNMSYMFSDCKSLEKLNLNSFDTINVTDMSYMFNSCHNLLSLDLSGFNTSSVKNMSYMFNSCATLLSLDLSGFNTSNVENMAYMFTSCRRLTQLNLSNFDFSNVTDANKCFYDCVELKNIDLSNSIITSAFANVGERIIDHYDNVVEYINLENASLVGDVSYLFYEYWDLIELNLTNVDTSEATNMSWMFYDCNKINNLDFSSFDTSKVTNMSYMFYNCQGFTTINLEGLDTENVTNIESMFEMCCELVSLDLSSLEFSNITSLSRVFSNCWNLQVLDISNFDLTKITIMVGTFEKIGRDYYYINSGQVSIYVKNQASKDEIIRYDRVYNYSVGFSDNNIIIKNA